MLHTFMPSRIPATHVLIALVGFVASMVIATVARAGELSGDWTGFYEYGNGQPGVPFIMSLNHSGSSISGDIVEVQSFGDKDPSGALSASLSGRGDTVSISFSKTYDGTGGVSHTVTYRGTIMEADNGQIIAAGTWETGGMQGGWMAFKEN